jgi:hypothetical protein
MPVTIIDACSDHLTSIQAFFARIYRPDYVLRRNEPLLRWQFGTTPASKGNKYHIKLALHNGEIIGSLGYIPVEFSLNGQTVYGAWAANWIVDPKWRKGVGVALMYELTSQFDITLAVGTNRVAEDILTVLRWTNLGELTRYVCVLDTYAARMLTETGKLEWPINILEREWKPPQEITIRVVENFSKDTTLFWDRVWEGKVTGTRRSAEFLNWRYANHPVFSYRLFEAYYRGRLSGFAVYHIEQVRNIPVNVGRMVELVAVANVEDCLLRAVIDDALSHDVAVLDFFCSSQRFSPLMARQGFLPGKDNAAAQIPILFQPIARQSTGISFLAYLANLPDVNEIQDWYVTKSDGDQDRPN